MCLDIQDGDIIMKGKRKGATARSVERQASLEQVTAGVNYIQVLLGQLRLHEQPGGPLAFTLLRQLI